MAFFESNFDDGVTLQMALLASKRTSTFSTPGCAARVSRTLGRHPVGHVMPGTLNTTVWRLAPPPVVEPDAGPLAGPELVPSEQPTTISRASRTPHKRFILVFLSRNEKNMTRFGTTGGDNSRIAWTGNRLNDGERDA